MPCGYWETYYRLDSDVDAACATPPPYGQANNQNLAPFKEFRARNSNAARYNPAAETPSPAAEQQRGTPSGQVALLGGGGLSSDFSGLVPAPGAEGLSSTLPGDIFPMGITSDFSNLGSGGGPSSVQLLEPSSVSAQQGPPGGK